MFPIPGNLDGASAQRITVTVAGSAQDGGVPQIWCKCPNCEAARRAGARRYAASLIVDVQSGGPGERPWRLLIDAGPDLRSQMEVFPGPVDAVALTHLHIGHYLGLAEFGREVANCRDVPLYCTPMVGTAFSNSMPWRFLIERGNLSLARLAAGQTCEPLPGVQLSAVAVPHRDEIADTVGYVLRRVGQTRGGLLYIPDADTWQGMRPGLPELVQSVDVALLDGTFFSHEELGRATGRDAGDVPHPPVPETLELLGNLTRRVVFTHINHSNPLLRDNSPQCVRVRAEGASVAVEGTCWCLV